MQRLKLNRKYYSYLSFKLRNDKNLESQIINYMYGTLLLTNVYIYTNTVVIY